jgi:hypothetical protein
MGELYRGYVPRSPFSVRDKTLGRPQAAFFLARRIPRALHQKSPPVSPRLRRSSAQAGYNNLTDSIRKRRTLREDRDLNLHMASIVIISFAR